MTTNAFIKLIDTADLSQLEDPLAIKNLIEKYPYLQSAKALYLKVLKDKESYKYNHQLKITAAHTTDRSVLFDFITSTLFKNKTVTEEKPSLKDKLLSKLKSSEVSNDKSLEEKLGIGLPLSFSKSESFSFNQWLDLSDKKVIVREEASELPKTNDKKTEKDAIIDRFIENNPKISRPSKTNTSNIKVNETQSDNQLMTETLAKVYLEQKKYDSAIQAYKILSLKYPEKSGFFADQVKRIKILQNNK